MIVFQTKHLSQPEKSSHLCVDKRIRPTSQGAIPNCVRPTRQVRSSSPLQRSSDNTTLTPQTSRSIFSLHYFTMERLKASDVYTFWAPKLCLAFDRPFRRREDIGSPRTLKKTGTCWQLKPAPPHPFCSQSDGTKSLHQNYRHLLNGEERAQNQKRE